MVWYLTKGLIALFALFIVLGTVTIIISLIMFLLLKQRQKLSSIYYTMIIISAVGILFFSILGSFYAQFAFGLTAYVSKPIAFLLGLCFTYLIFKFSNDEFNRTSLKILNREFILSAEINQFTKSNTYDNHRILSFRYLVLITYILFSFKSSWIPSFIFNINSKFLEIFF